MASEQKTNPITKTVDKIEGSKSKSEMSEQLTAELQKLYGGKYQSTRLHYKIATPSILDALKKDESSAHGPVKKCKDCDHSHIDHERYQTDSFIHIHDPVQKQIYHSISFRNSLASPCWDCRECYEDNQLAVGDDLEHESMPKWSWVWRESNTINGITGHLVYQVPASKYPIRTRDGFAVPWHRYYCEEHLRRDPASDLKLANRVAIKDLIEEDYCETLARAEACCNKFETFNAKLYHIQSEDSKHYGFSLDSTLQDTEEDLAILTLFDMAVVETMKIHPEITRVDLNKEVARRMRIWTKDHFFPCGGAIWRTVDNIAAQGFITICVNEDKSKTLLSESDDKRCTPCEILWPNDAVRSFQALGNAELDAKSTLSCLQGALNDKSCHSRPGFPTSSQRFGLASRNTEVSLKALRSAVAKARTTLESIEADGAEKVDQDALVSWKASLSKFETKSKRPIDAVQSPLAENSGRYSVIMVDEMYKCVGQLLPELEALRVSMEAFQDHITNSRVRNAPESAAESGAPAGEDLGEGTWEVVSSKEEPSVEALANTEK